VYEISIFKLFQGINKLFFGKKFKKLGDEASTIQIPIKIVKKENQIKIYLKFLSITESIIFLNDF
jgi:hypothetical protein